jgi:hypothetical protein
MSIEYSSILSKAWNITWKYKILWFFGFLAILAQGGSGFSGSNGGFGGFQNQINYNLGPREVEQANLPPALRDFVDQLKNVDVNTWVTIAVLVACVLLFLGIALWLISIIGRGGLIAGIVSADSAGKVAFGEAWNAGLRFYVRLLLIRLLEFAVGILMFLVLILPGIFFGIITCGIGFIPLVCVLIVAGVVINIWFAFMDFAVVVENQGVGAAIGRAWNVVRDHIGPIIIFYIILFAVSLVVGIAMLILFLPAGVLIFLSVLPALTGAAATVNVPVLIVGIVLMAAYLLFSILVRSVFMTWRTGVLTLAYREFIKRTPLPAAAMGSETAGSA